MKIENILNRFFNAVATIIILAVLVLLGIVLFQRMELNTKILEGIECEKDNDTCNSA